jgi:hypothetical protein
MPIEHYMKKYHVSHAKAAQIQRAVWANRMRQAKKGNPKYIKYLRGRGWHGDPMRHSMAARGMKTRTPKDMIEHPMPGPCGHCFESEYCPGYGSCDKFKAYRKEQNMKELYGKLNSYYSKREETMIIANRILYGKEPEVDKFLSEVMAKVKPLYEGGYMAMNNLPEIAKVDAAIQNILIRMNDLMIEYGDQGTLWIKFTDDLQKAVVIPDYEWGDNTRSNYIDDPLGGEIRSDIEYLKSIARRQ